MTITEHYIRYLSEPASKDNQLALAEALDNGGFRLEAELLRHYTEQGEHSRIISQPDSLLLGHRVWVGRQLPVDAAAGDVWFDTLELVASLLTPREPLPRYEGPLPAPNHNYPPLLVWLTVRPTAWWQYEAFVQLAPLEANDAAAETPLKLFDLNRTPHRVETDPVTDILSSEATFYARWFGKILPSLGHWENAAQIVSAAMFELLWDQPGREWSSSVPVSDDDVQVLATPETLTIDVDELFDEWDASQSDDSSLLFGPWEHRNNVGFRTAITAQIGLIQVEHYERVQFGNYRLTSPLKR